MAQTINDREYLLRWIPELFTPVDQPTGRSGESVRFGVGELELPGTVYSHWAVIRGLVWAFQEEAPTAWSEIQVLAQDAVNELTAQWLSSEAPDRWVMPEEPDGLDQLFLAHAAVRCKRAGLVLEIPGLRPEAEEIAASAHPSAPLIVRNVGALHAWQVKWNLGEDRSLFGLAVFTVAILTTDQFRHLSPTNTAWVIFASLLDAGLPNVSKMPDLEPPPAAAPETALLPPSPKAPPFEPRFHPGVEDGTPYIEAKLEAYKRELRAHVADQRAYWQARGLAPAPEKRVADQHFRYYIRFQVLGQSFSEIAKAECATPGAVCVSPGAVSRAVKSVAELAHVPLRESKRGRPRKKHPQSASGISI